MFETFLLLMAVHFIADFPFQGSWLDANKGKSWELMFYHCAIYTGTFIVFAHASVTFAMVLFASHLIIDPLKARYNIIKPIWVDQFLHILVIICCLMVNIV